MGKPAVLVFDVNETLSDMSAMGDRFGEVGAPPELAPLWFASLLRDGFALAAAGSSETFADIGRGVLRQLLAGRTLGRGLDEAVESIMAGFLTLRLHPDVTGAVRELHGAGLRLVTLTNGSPQVAERLFATAGIREDFESLLSVEEAGVWKPARGAYEYAARTCHVQPADMVLVAVHPWDIDGANRAGMRTAWVNRSAGEYPEHFSAPTYAVSSLTDLPAALT